MGDAHGEDNDLIEVGVMNHGKGRRILGVVFALVFFIYITVMMAMAIKANNTLETNTNEMSYVIENWSERPIVDITSDMSPCQNGYVPMFRNKWPGTVEGCDCRHAWRLFSTSLQTGRCTHNETRDGCVNVRPI